MVLLDFLFELRRRGIGVGLQEWLSLMEALARGLHGSQLTGFYHLARSLLVHREEHFDSYDRAFLTVFKGIESAREQLSLPDELAAWLADPAQLAHLTAEERRALEALDLERLRELFRQRLAEQRERHEGGDRWIGTGGTSPFGQGGHHPSGIRLGAGGGRSAAQIAAERRFRPYRADLTLDVRQIQLALRKLRQLRREGQRQELDLDETVDRTSRNAGELELVWRPPRRNNVKLLLLMDVGGSMTPHSRVVSRLFSAADQSKHFRDFHAYYFHNCVYEHVYADSWFREPLPVGELVATYPASYKLVVVGDALMHPMELFDVGGAIDYWQNNATAGLEWLRRLASHYRRHVWLNPEPRAYWRHVTVNAIRELFPMYPLTLDGLRDAVAALVRGTGDARPTP